MCILIIIESIPKMYEEWNSCQSWQWTETKLPCNKTELKWCSKTEYWIGDGGCSFLATYRLAIGSSPWACSKGRRPSGAVLHSSHEPGVRRPYMTLWTCYGTLKIIVSLLLSLSSSSSLLLFIIWIRILVVIITEVLFPVKWLFEKYYWKLYNGREKRPLVCFRRYLVTLPYLGFGWWYMMLALQ